MLVVLKNQIPDFVGILFSTKIRDLHLFSFHNFTSQSVLKPDCGKQLFRDRLVNRLARTY